MLSRSCRPSGHPVSGNDPGSSFAPWSRSAQSATRPIATQPSKLTHAWRWLCPSPNSCGIRTPRRLIPTRRRGGAWVQSRCRHSARTERPGLVAASWRGTASTCESMLSGNCHPSLHAVSRERSRTELRAFLQTAMRRRVDSRPLTTGAGTDRDPKPEEFWSVPVPPCHGSRMGRHQQDVWVDVGAKVAPIRAPPLPGADPQG